MDKKQELSEVEALSRAKSLLDRVSLVDAHNDLPYVVWMHPEAKGDARIWNAAKVHPETDTDIPRLREGKVGTQVFTAFIPTNVHDPLRARLEGIDVMLQLEQLHPDVFLPVLTPDDIAAAKKAGKIGLLKAVEGLVSVDKVGHLRLFHAMGIRLITLCHNETLPFIDSATDKPGQQPLSAFGAEIIAEMERLGLMIDLAHVSAEGQHAVLDIAKGPMVISHANARALCDHPRNAPDDIIKRIADGGGMVMPTFVPSFLQQTIYNRLKPIMDGMGKMKEGLEKAAYKEAKKAAFDLFARDGIALVCDHLEYMRNIVGPDALGIGSDFYGGPNPPGLEDATRFPYLFAALIRRGWKTGDLEKLAGGNFERVWRTVYRSSPVL